MEVRHDWFRLGGGVQSRPVAVLLGWVGATTSALQRYAEVYNKFGWDVLAFRFPFLSLWFPHWAFNNAVEVLDCIMQEFVQHGPRDIIFVVCSGAAKMCHYRLLEILGGKHKQHDFCCLYSAVKDNCIGQVYDSSPVDFTSQAGVAFLTSQRGGVVNALKKSGAEFAAGFLDFFLVEWFEKDRQRMWDVLSHPPVGGPLLFLYSLGDHLADAALIREMAGRIRGRGRTVVEHVWPDAPHMKLLQTHTLEYVDAVGYFLGLFPRPGHGGRNMASPGRSGGHDLSSDRDAGRDKHANAAATGAAGRERVGQGVSSLRPGALRRFQRTPSEESFMDSCTVGQSGRVNSSSSASTSNRNGTPGSASWRDEPAGKAPATEQPARAGQRSGLHNRTPPRSGLLTNIMSGFEEQLLRSCGVATVIGGLPADTPFHSSGLPSSRSSPGETLARDPRRPLSPNKPSSSSTLSAESSLVTSLVSTKPGGTAEDSGWLQGAGGWGRAWRVRWLGRPEGVSAQSGGLSGRHVQNGGTGQGGAGAAGSRDGSGAGRQEHAARRLAHFGGIRDGAPTVQAGGAAGLSSGGAAGGVGRGDQSTCSDARTDGLVMQPKVSELGLRLGLDFCARDGSPVSRLGSGADLAHHSAGGLSGVSCDGGRLGSTVLGLVEGPSHTPITESCCSSLNPLHEAGEQLRTTLSLVTNDLTPAALHERNRPLPGLGAAREDSSLQLPGSCPDRVHAPSSSGNLITHRSALSTLLHDTNCRTSTSDAASQLPQPPASARHGAPGWPHPPVSSQQRGAWLLDQHLGAVISHPRPLSKM